MPNQKKRKATAGQNTAVVGLGASAGGLDALKLFLARVPPASGLAYIVVQHLDPTQKAMLSQLLQRATEMPVCEAVEHTPIEPDHVYVIPPNRVLTLLDGELHLSSPTQARGLRLPIDQLFESIAKVKRQQAVGIVLSGMGSDGTAGLRAIKAAGGLTLAQQPETAQFDSMPNSAITTGCVDIVCAPQDMPAQIAARRMHDVIAADHHDAQTIARGMTQEARPNVTATGEDALQLQAILSLLKKHVKHDFTLYKHSTLLRRIERRLGIHGLSTLGDYAQLLKGDEQELNLLFKELLIGVTAFFRDTDVWKVMQEQVLPAMLAPLPDGHELRAWVAGCSTGEEAYTLAMLFREVVGELPAHANTTLQIFATDLSKDAIEAARRGLYPASIEGAMSAQRLARFFTREGESYRIGKSIREMIVFATHNVNVDPPFTQLDILSCRNLLIYLTAPLQQRLLPLFHYSLRKQGVLLLGTSENVGRFEDLFEPIDLKLRLFRRRESNHAAAPINLPFMTKTLSPSAEEPAVPNANRPASNLQTLADHLLLQEFSPAAVLVNDRGDILYINGRTGKYLEPAAGKANWNIHVMARQGLRSALASGLHQAASQSAAVELKGLTVEDGKQKQGVDLTVRALHEPKALAGMAMIVFRDAAAPPSPRRRRSTSTIHRELEAQLERARDEAQTLREEMRASQEELQAANEELQSTNEELQSTNEELTSSKEEMQSMNEELHAVNGELRSKLDDLSLAQSDMSNLLNSTDIATLFLDGELNVRRFTEQARKIISLRDTDIGRPLSELSTSLDYPELKTDVQETLRTLKFVEKQIPAAGGLWYLVRIMPYRAQNDVVQGTVLTFIDITKSKQLEERLRALAPDQDKPQK